MVDDPQAFLALGQLGYYLGAVRLEAEAQSLAAQRPYDLRHACVSTWLNATGDPAQVAEWAGHSVNVLMRVYAKRVSGRQEANKRRIFDATCPLKAPAPPAEAA